MYNAPEILIKTILPYEVSRMGSALLTTASICADYRLQEVFRTNKDYCHRKVAAKIGRLCAKNGGIYIKAAQHLASMDHILPKEYIIELSQLQDQAPVSPIKVVEQVFKEEIGKEISEIFSDICDVPIGSASIGQVHLARLKSTGEQVALKIQHLNIKKDSEIDLNSFRIALKLIKRLFPTVNFDWIVDELRNSLDSELNFLIEAENSIKAKEAFEKDPKFRNSILIPNVYSALTTKRVLVMQFVPGFKINDRKRMKEAGIDTAKVSKLMYELFMEMIFKHQFVHCDPHPGNILVNYDKSTNVTRIVLLDHGLYKSVPTDVLTKFSRLFLAVLEKDSLAIAKLSVELKISVEVLNELSDVVQRMTAAIKAKNNSIDQTSINDQIQREITKFLKTQPEAKKRRASEALKTIPREIIFIIRILDLLRSNERNLTQDYRQSTIPESIMIIMNYCLAHIGGQDLSLRNSIILYAKLLKTYLGI